MELFVWPAGFRPSQERSMADAAPSAPKPAGNGATPRDIEKQIETIRADITELTRQVADLIGQVKDNTMAQVKSQVSGAKSTADSVLSDVKDSGRDAVDAFRDVADTFGDAVEDSLKRRPYATLAVVAGIGFLFGVAWRR